MSEKIVELKHVDKRFKDFKALTDVSVSLEKGKIYGLIGKNGAGKTTMMRIIAGLGFPTAGELELFGATTRKEINRKLCKVGSLIEYPSLNGAMTARENMIFFYKLRGLKVDDSIQNLLERVDIADTGRKKVKDFSLGMRQRLGIAVAMIGNPELLILDEPVNGLDPIGIVEIRNFLKKLNEKTGITILISSHNLPELYQTATDYIIIDKGHVKKLVTLAELEAHGENNLEEYFISTIMDDK